MVKLSRWWKQDNVWHCSMAAHRFHVLSHPFLFPSARTRLCPFTPRAHLSFSERLLHFCMLLLLTCPVSGTVPFFRFLFRFKTVPINSNMVVLVSLRILCNNLGFYFPVLFCAIDSAHCCLFPHMVAMLLLGTQIASLWPWEVWYTPKCEGIPQGSVLHSARKLSILITLHEISVFQLLASYYMVCKPGVSVSCGCVPFKFFVSILGKSVILFITLLG